MEKLENLENPEMTCWTHMGILIDRSGSMSSMDGEELAGSTDSLVLEKKKEGKKVKDDRVILIMDDCMSSKGTWVKEEQILELFFNGRHHHLSFILTMQYAIGIPPEMRSNFDFIFLILLDVVFLLINKYL